MRLARRTFLASAMASVAAPAVLRVAFADAPQFTFKLHHAMSAVSSSHDRFLVPWARKVEAQSAGRIRIDLFPSMQLGGQPAQLFDQARDGTADIVWTMPSATPGRFAKTELFELPFVVAAARWSTPRRSTTSPAPIWRTNTARCTRSVSPVRTRACCTPSRPVHIIDDLQRNEAARTDQARRRSGADARRPTGADAADRNCRRRLLSTSSTAASIPGIWCRHSSSTISSRRTRNSRARR